MEMSGDAPLKRGFKSLKGTNSVGLQLYLAPKRYLFKTNSQTNVIIIFNSDREDFVVEMLLNPFLVLRLNTYLSICCLRPLINEEHFFLFC